MTHRYSHGQKGSALILVLALSVTLFMLIQTATMQVYRLERELDFMEEKHNRDFRKRRPEMAVEPPEAEKHSKESERPSAQ